MDQAFDPTAFKQNKEKAVYYAYCFDGILGLFKEETNEFGTRIPEPRLNFETTFWRETIENIRLGFHLLTIPRDLLESDYIYIEIIQNVSLLYLHNEQVLLYYSKYCVFLHENRKEFQN